MFAEDIYSFSLI